jgi:hypothetical protein
MEFPACLDKLSGTELLDALLKLTEFPPKPKPEKPIERKAEGQFVLFQGTK